MNQGKMQSQVEMFVEVEEMMKVAVTPSDEEVKVVSLRRVSMLEETNDVMLARKGQEKAKDELVVKTPNEFKKSDDT